MVWQKDTVKLVVAVAEGESGAMGGAGWGSLQ